MDLLFFLASFCGGAALTFFLLQRHIKSCEAQKKEIEKACYQLENENGALRAHLERLSYVEAELKSAQDENRQLLQELAALKEAKKSEEEKVLWTEKYEKSLKDTFTALSSQLLEKNATSFITQAKEQLQFFLKQIEGHLGIQKAQMEKFFSPLQESLTRLDQEVRALEEKRARAYEKLDQQLARLDLTTSDLSRALTAPAGKGSWGQLQLQRVVEMAGLAKHIDYSEQEAIEKGRPDMIVKLPGGGVIPIDAKVTLEPYRKALNAKDEELRRQALKEHALAIKSRIQELSQREYWESCEKVYGKSPQLVIMYVPWEASLSAAFEVQPELLEFAVQKHVLVTTPITLLALLKAIAYGWQQYEIGQNALRVAAVGKELYQRLVTFASEHLTKIRNGLEVAVKSYNRAIGSMERSVLPKAREFRQLQGLEPAPEEIDLQEVDIALSEFHLPKADQEKEQELL